MKSYIITRNRLFVLIAFAALFFCIAGSSHALAAEAQNLPWEQPLTKLGKSLTGPVAQAVCLIAIVICGLTLIFGGEMGEFAKRMIYVVIVIAFILGASGFVSTMFTSQGALV